MNRVGAARRDLCNLIEPNAVFITEGQIKKQIGDRKNPARSQCCGALRADAFQIFHFGRETYIHSGSIYTIASVDRPRLHSCQAMHRLAAGESPGRLGFLLGDALAAPDLTRESSPNVLSRGDVRVLLLGLLAALVGASVAYRYFFRAFPEASVDFKVTRAAALERARAFAGGQGFSLQGYQSAIVFNVDDDTKTFLEREVGLEQANRLMSSEVSVWYWYVRFFRPRQKEELRVRVDPKGGIVGYEHILEEAAPGARLDQSEAFARAEQFLTQTLRIDLGTYAFLPEVANSNTRPNRTDWSFTWERKGFRVKDAPYRLQVTIEGDKPGGYAEFLKVPEAWQRNYARLRSSNNFIETIALIPYAILIGAALSVLIILGRRGLIRWKWAIGIGLFITALYFAMQLNEWPLIRAGYDTNDSYASFVATEVSKALLQSFSL